MSAVTKPKKRRTEGRAEDRSTKSRCRKAERYIPRERSGVSRLTTIAGGTKKLVDTDEVLRRQAQERAKGRLSGL